MRRSLLSRITGVNIMKWQGGARSLVFYVFGWHIVFGNFGNPRRTIRFQFTSSSLRHCLEIEFISPGWLTTNIYLGIRNTEPGPFFRCNWNSEWIAKKWGVWTDEETYMQCGVEAAQYDGWLGHHMYC